MHGDADIAAVAALLGDRARASIVSALADGRALPAGELAGYARISAATASAHLGKLVSGGTLSVERCGRHRYYRLANERVAAAVEALSVIAPPLPPRTLRQAHIADGLREARTCYDHVGGRLGVDLARRLCERGVLTSDALALTAPGEDWMAALGIDVAALRRGRRPLTRACLDWSERRHHLAGALGAALAERLFDLRWLERRPDSRAVTVTAHGRAGLTDALGAETIQRWTPPRRARARAAIPSGA